jgi:hypothetical protein
MFNISKKKEVVFNPPTVGALFEWSEPTAYSIGTVRSVEGNKITLNIFPDNEKDTCDIVTLEKKNGTVFIHRSDGTVGELWKNYIETYFKFHNTTEEKKALLQQFIKYKNEVVLPKYETKLEFQKNELNQFQEMLLSL